MEIKIRDASRAFFAALTWLTWLFAGAILAFLFAFKERGGVVGELLILSMLLAVLGLVSAILVFTNYNKGIVINKITRSVSIPGSDPGDSVVDALLLKGLWGQFVREDIVLDEITDIRGDTITQNKIKSYRLNISGTFGSRQLEFSSKQKMDECRARLREAQDEA